MKKIITVCYGKKEEWESRKQAMDSFMEAICGSDGSEQITAEDIAGWARSLQLRHIPLPPEVSDELLLIVREARENPSQ